MSRAVAVGRQKTVVCVGDLSKRVLIQTRVLAEPVNGLVDPTLSFTTVETVWAKIETATGKIMFDGVNTDIAITHTIFIRWRTGISETSWVEFKSNRYDIKNVENFEERGDFLKLSCVLRGPTSKRASDA